MLTILLALCSLGWGCGVSIHLSLVGRITPQLPANITDRLQFARAGAFFPDAFYGCMGKSEAAEAAHWPPFLAHGIDLVREKVLAGQRDEALNLYAFLYGVLSHQVADVTWHSLGFQQGLLDAMTHIEFAGDNADAHSTLDAGGDFIYLHRLLASGADTDWLQERWDYDSQDIILLLSKLGFSITKYQLGYCMSRGRAALSGELKIADPAYIHYAQKSPLLYGNLEDYFAGGIAEMHSQTLECMQEFGTWLENPPADPWDLCQVFQGKRPHQKRQTVLKRINRGLRSMHSYFSIKSLEAPKFSCETQLLRGRVPWSQFGKNVKWWESARLWIVSSPQDGLVYYYNDRLEFEVAVQGLTKLPGLYHARFGTGLETIKVGNKEYLAISSPGLCVLDFFDARGEYQGGVSWKNAAVEFGSQGVKLVGESLLFADETLYVGAPYSDEGGVAQSGAVYTLGKKTLAEALSSAGGPRTVVVPDQLDHPRSNYGRFGARLARSNMFLLVGSPGNDTVYGYDRLTHKKLLKLLGEPNSGFGGHMLVARDTFIAVGAAAGSGTGAGASSGGEQSGLVYVYENTEHYTLAGDSAYGRFGHSGAVIGHEAFIGSPFADHERGVLWRAKLGEKSYKKQENGPQPFSGAFCDLVVSNSTHVACTVPFHDDIGAVAFISVVNSTSK